MTLDPSLLLFFAANRHYLAMASPTVLRALVGRSRTHYRANAQAAALLWMLKRQWMLDTAMHPSPLLAAQLVPTQ